jgi:processive 1,2-diacylglycerol beta-glucosyltransferase
MHAMPDKKILLLSVSAGAGHVRAADAVQAYAARPGLSAMQLDLMSLVGSPLRRIYVDLYLWLVRRAPRLWGLVYRLTDREANTGWTGRFCHNAARLASPALLREIESYGPDVIVCTHFLPAEILSALRAEGKVGCPVWVQVTDFDLHRMWVHEHMSGYFAASERVASRLRALGIADSMIHLNAMPVMPAFACTPPRSECARQLGLDPARTTVLLMGGGAGLGKLEEVAERLLRQHRSIQLIAVAGKNAAALEALQALALHYPGRLLAVGYTREVEKLMACADLIVTKPGGLTSAECLAMGLPMIANAPIPGQEALNASYLRDKGVALTAANPQALDTKLHHLLANPAVLADMRRRARALGRPDAARFLIDTVLNNPRIC